MIVSLSLENNAVRVTASLLLVIFVVLAGILIWKELLIGVYSDERVSGPGIFAALEYSPNSSRLRERLAELQIQDMEELEAARENIGRAIKYAPNDYTIYLLKARIEQFLDNSPEADTAFSNAKRLAPNYSEVYWLAGNFYLRQNEFEKAVKDFQVVAKLNPSLVPAILDMVWILSDEDVSTLERVVNGNESSMLKLANFLARKGRGKEASAVFSQIDKDAIKIDPEANRFYVTLIQHGFGLTGYRLWRTANDILDEAGIFNGGFEVTDFSGPAEFDWTLTNNKYARLQLDDGSRHSGSRALLIDFRERETTILSNEISHLLPLPPNRRLRVTFYVKTEQLSTESSPKIAVENSKPEVIANSEPFLTGTRDWQCMGFDLETPQPPDGGDSELLYLRLKKQPDFVFEKPTFGKIWLDDFRVSEGGAPC